MKHRLLLTILATFMLGAHTASAGLIDISGGTAGSIPGGAKNDLLNGNVNNLYGTDTRDGYFGAQLLFGNGGSFVFDIEYLGKEAGFINTFTFNGSQIFSTATSSIGDTAGPFLLDAADFGGAGGIIPFLFSFNTTGSGGDVVNGANTDDSAGQSDQNFFVTCVDDPTATNCSVIDIFLDDGGAGPDDNHDDLAVRITARVPEPMTLALLGLGLIGLSLARSRKTA